MDPPVPWPVRSDSSFVGLETSSGRPVGRADDGSDSMETGSVASQPSLSGDLWPADRMVEKLAMIRDKKHYKSVPAVNAVGNGMTRHALMMALLTLLQSAESFEMEPNADKSDWVFTDLGLGICLVLMLQGLMLWVFFKCVTRHFQVHGGLSLGTKQVQTAEKGIDCEINTWSSRVYHLEGRDVFHVDTTCPRLEQRSRPFETLRLCKSCKIQDLW